MFDPLYYQKLVQQRIMESGRPGRENPREQLLEEIRRTGEYHIHDSARLERGLPIDISIHQPGATGPHAENPHYHDFFELLYVYRGSVVNVVHRQEHVTVDSKHVLLMNPNSRHLPLCDELDTIAFNIMLRRSFIEETVLNLIGGNNFVYHFFLHSIYGENEMRDYLFLPVNDEIEMHIHSMIREHCEEKPFYEQMLVSNLILLLGEFARIQKQETDLESQRLIGSGKLSDMLRYIQLHYATVTLQSMAEHFSYSDAYLSRLIKKETGKSFSEIVSGIRFHTTCNYLKHSTLTIEKISDIVGYQNVGNFFRAFKKNCGVSPSDYRRQNQTESSARPSISP